MEAKRNVGPRMPFHTALTTTQAYLAGQSGVGHWLARIAQQCVLRVLLLILNFMSGPHSDLWSYRSCLLLFLV